MNNKDVIIACDFSSQEQTMEFLSMFVDKKPYVKIGMELYYSCGPSIVEQIKAAGHKIFLDLKLHDIPNTVAKAMNNIANLDVDMTNVHAAGGIKMMSAAAESIRSAGKKTKLIAVTQLTSTSEAVMHEELKIDKELSINDCISQYAKNTLNAGLDGVVCSPLESEIIKNACGNDFLTCTPGIRFAQDAVGDQVRITTPKDARKYSDYIVVGRSITAAADPVIAYNKCIEDFLGE